MGVLYQRSVTRFACSDGILSQKRVVTRRKDLQYIYKYTYAHRQNIILMAYPVHKHFTQGYYRPINRSLVRFLAHVLFNIHLQVRVHIQHLFKHALSSSIFYDAYRRSLRCFLQYSSGCPSSLLFCLIQYIIYLCACHTMLNTNFWVVSRNCHQYNP